MIKAKDYFDPQVYERMAQIQAQNALQQGNIRANAQQQNAQLLANLLPQLAQMYGQYQQKQEANDYFSPKDYTVGDQRPIGGEKVVRTDLLGKPITPTLVPQYQEQGTFNPMTDPSRLMQGQMNENPEIARRSQIGIQNLLMQQPKMFEQSPGSIATDVNRFSPTFGQRTSAPFKPSPKIALLRTEQEKQNGVMKNADYYGYVNDNGVEVVTNKKYSDFTPAKPTSPYYGEKRLVKSYQDSFNADPSIKSFKEQGLSLGAVNGLIDQANSGNQVSAAALGVKMAKVMGETGMLSENDVTRYVQAKSLGRGSEDVLRKWIQGVPTKATLSEIREIANVMRDQFTEKLQPVIDLHANQMSEGLGISLEEARRYLSAEQLTNPIIPKSSNVGSAKKISTKAEYDKLPSGTEYIAPDGTKRRKK